MGSLWNSAGTRLAQVTFTNETATGWQTATLATPVALVTGQTYVVSYRAPNGRYSSTSGFFNQTYTSGVFTASGPNNGRYRYGTGGVMPASHGTPPTTSWTWCTPPPPRPNNRLHRHPLRQLPLQQLRRQPRPHRRALHRPAAGSANSWDSADGRPSGRAGRQQTIPGAQSVLDEHRFGAAHRRPLLVTTGTMEASGASGTHANDFQRLTYSWSRLT